MSSTSTAGAQAGNRGARRRLGRRATGASSCSAGSSRWSARSALSSAVGTNYSNSFSLKGTDSQRAVDLLKRDFPAQSGDSDQIVFHARSGSVTEAAVRARVAPMLAQIARLPHVSGVVSPYSPPGAREISRDGQIAFATVNFDQRANVLPKAAVERVISIADSAPLAAARGRSSAARRSSRSKKPSLGDRDGGRPDRRDDRAAHHLRLGARDGAADPHRAARTGHRRSGSPASPRR